MLFSRSVMSDSFQPHGLRHARLPCPSPSPRAYSNSCPLSRWCHPTISSSVVPFSSCPQYFPASESFPVSQLFSSGGSFSISLLSVFSNMQCSIINCSHHLVRTLHQFLLFLFQFLDSTKKWNQMVFVIFVSLILLPRMPSRSMSVANVKVSFQTFPIIFSIK